MSTRLYSMQEAAALIGFSDARLRQLILTGRAKPRQRIGPVWVFSQAEVNRLSSTRRKAGRPKG